MGKKKKAAAARKVEPGDAETVRDANRLVCSMSTLCHGFDNVTVFNALLAFTASVIVSQTKPELRGGLTEKYVNDLVEAITGVAAQADAKR
jgi:hypothetical protein